MQNARLYAEAKRRQEWLEAARAITTRLLGGTAIEEVFPDIVAAARRLADADIALLALPMGDGRCGSRRPTGRTPTPCRATSCRPTA